METITKEEFINRFNDKQKIEIAEKYLEVYYDSYITDSNYIQQVQKIKSSLTLQKLTTPITDITNQKKIK